MPLSGARDFQVRFFRQNSSLEPVLRLMAATPNACFFVKDLESRYVMCNAFNLVTYDLSREENLVGRAARDFLPNLLPEA